MVLEEVTENGKKACGEGALLDAQGRTDMALALEVRVQLPSVSSMSEVAVNVEIEHLELSIDGTPFDGPRPQH